MISPFLNAEGGIAGSIICDFSGGLKFPQIDPQTRALRLPDRQYKAADFEGLYTSQAEWLQPLAHKFRTAGRENLLSNRRYLDAGLAETIFEYPEKLSQFQRKPPKWRFTPFLYLDFCLNRIEQV